MMDEKVKEIIQVAGSLFSRRGIKAVTMTELAHTCGISKKTLYFHFRDKDDLLFIVISTNYKTIRNQIIQLKERTVAGPVKLDKFARLVKVQSKVFTPLFLSDLMKYYYRISLLVDWQFKRLMSMLIDMDSGRKWYGWQLIHIFQDFSLPEEERQCLLDQINFNYQRWLTVRVNHC